MKIVSLGIALAAVFLLSSIYGGEIYAQSETKTQTIQAYFPIIQKVPFFGEVGGEIYYDLKLNIEYPSYIEAGKTTEITITPLDGKTTVYPILSGDRLAKDTYFFDLGEKGKIIVPHTYVIEFFVTPYALFNPQISGPGQVSNQLVSLNSMNENSFSIYVNNEIGSSDSVQVSIPSAIKFQLGTGLNIPFIGEQKFYSTELLENSSPIITLDIPLRKYHDTSLSIEVKDGSRPGYVKVKPNLRIDTGSYLSQSVNILVDGVYKTKINSNNWSGDIQTGSGFHNIEARFDESRDKNNQAIIYLTSKDLKSFKVKEAPKPVVSTSNQRSTTGLTCGEGTHEENGKCVPDSFNFNFFDDLFAGISNAFAGILTFFTSVGEQTEQTKISPVEKPRVTNPEPVKSQTTTPPTSKLSGSPAIESIEIISYDARGDAIFVGIENLSASSVSISEIRVAGTFHGFNVGLEPRKYADEYHLFNPSSKQYLIQPTLKSGEKVLVKLISETEFQEGRDIQFKLSTTSGNIFVGTIVAGEKSD